MVEEEATSDPEKDPWADDNEMMSEDEDDDASGKARPRR